MAGDLAACAAAAQFSRERVTELMGAAPAERSCRRGDVAACRTVKQRCSSAFADDVLLAAWRNTPDKGAFMDALPSREAARLCDLLNADRPRGRAILGRAPRRK